MPPATHASRDNERVSKVIWHVTSHRVANTTCGKRDVRNQQVNAALLLAKTRESDDELIFGFIQFSAKWFFWTILLNSLMEFTGNQQILVEHSKLMSSYFSKGKFEHWMSSIQPIQKILHEVQHVQRNFPCDMLLAWDLFYNRLCVRVGQKKRDMQRIHCSATVIGVNSSKHLQYLRLQIRM